MVGINIAKDIDKSQQQFHGLHLIFVSALIGLAVLVVGQVRDKWDRVAKLYMYLSIESDISCSGHWFGDHDHIHDHNIIIHEHKRVSQY